MSKKLPYAGRTVSFEEDLRTVFSGINKSEGMTEGAIFDTENMTSDFYPAIGTRAGRSTLLSLKKRKIWGAGYSKNLYYCADDEDGKTYFYYDNEKYFEVIPCEKSFCVINSFICVFPDKMYFSELYFEAENFGEPYATLDELHVDMLDDKTLKGGECYVADGAIYTYNPSGKWQGNLTKEGDANPTPFAHQAQTEWIYISEIYGSLETDSSIGERSDGILMMTASGDTGDDTIEDWNSAKNLRGMKTGDALTLTVRYRTQGLPHETIYKTYDCVLNEVKALAAKRHYRYTFLGISVPKAVDADGNEASGGQFVRYSATVKKKVPDFGVCYTHQNRIWGAEEGKVYSSALGDPTQFTAYNTSASGAWTWQSTGSAFTGGCSFSGYPTFFKEDKILKIGGDYPSEYTTYETESVQGVKEGCGRSLAICGGYLFYVSSEGIMRYSGSFPVRVGSELGSDEKALSNAFGASSGGKYYLCSSGTLYVYDTQKGFWLIEDKDAEFNGFMLKEGALFGIKDNSIVKFNLTSGEEADEEEIFSEIYFSPFFGSTLNKKGLLRLNVNLEAEGKTRIYVSYDNEPFKKVWEASSRERKSFSVPIKLRRADMFRMKIKSYGRMKLYAISKTFYRGSRF